MEPRKSIKDIVQEEFNKIEDKNSLKDKKNKKEFFDKLEENNKDLKRSSLEATFSTVLKKHCKENKIDFNDFSSKPQKRFSSSLDIQTSGKAVNIEESKEEKKQGVQIQNPKAKLENNEPKEYPLDSVAGSFNSFLKAIMPNIEDLSEQERHDAGMCLNMALGNILENSAKARALFGGMGLLGIYGGKIGEARKKGKLIQKEADKQKQKEKTRELPDITEEEKENFAINQEQFLNEQRALYENKGIQL